MEGLLQPQEYEAKRTTAVFALIGFHHAGLCGTFYPRILTLVELMGLWDLGGLKSGFTHS